MSSDPASPGLLAFFNCCPAFPSVSHQWILLVCHKSGLPGGLINMITCMYIGVSALRLDHFTFTNPEWSFAGMPSERLHVRPRPGSMFELIEDEVAKHQSGILRACADDLGAAFRFLDGLQVMFPIFQSSESVAGLHLKPKNCVLASIGQTLDQSLLDTIRDWLHTHIPLWADFRIASAARYLGLMMRPTASSTQWHAAKTKCWNRGCAPAGSHFPSRCILILTIPGASLCWATSVNLSPLPRNF